MTGERVNDAPRIRLPSPHNGQQTVRQQARRFNWLSAGRRWRKTTLMMTLAVEGMIAGETVIWGAPTFDQVRIGFEEMRYGLGQVANFNISRMTCDMPGGGKTYFRSMDKADNVRGYTADKALIDEAGFIKPDVWFEVMRPMLIDTGGDAWIGGTPKGHNWFWQGHHNAGDRDDSIAWQAPTLGVEITPNGLIRKPHPLENPHIQFSEMEHLYKTTPETIFRQEILAEFITGGGVFQRVAEAAIAEQLDKGEDSTHYAIGVDWGRQNDFTCFAVIDAQTRRMVYMDRFTQIDYNIQASRLKALYGRFPGYIVAEYNAMGGPIVERLQMEGLPVQGFVTTGGKTGSKEQIIRGLESAFSNGDIAILNDPVLIGELQAYEQEQLPAGGWKFGAPEGMHDDTVIALALAWSAVANAGPLVLW